MAFEPIIHLMRGIQTRLTGNMQSVDNAQHMAFLRQMQRELNQQEVLKIPLHQLDVVVLDIETTGFYPEKGDEIISIGAIKIKKGIVLEDQSFYSLIHCKREIPKEVTDLTSITNEQVKNAPLLLDVLVHFFKFTQNSPLVAHHSNHEKNFLQHTSRQLFRSPLKHRILDTSFLYRVAEPNVKMVRLEEFCEFHQIPIINRHNALEDAKVTAKLWCIYVEKVVEIGCLTLRDVYEKLALLK
ncbi:exonuclease domain-containing protein [Bacillus massiliigorillae]|uniref:exonuclease domain-containing protein n=1 Tax=Bacillus massiliigorillae TaxID=1243664 RepID=UPI0003A31ADA|nr:exonuclease domain-containing protein [Bacillus massiliigorillae]